MTSNGSESVQRKKKIEKFTEKMTRKTKFTESEVERLVLVYQKITESRYTTLKLDRKKFYEFLGDTFGMTDKIIMDRLYKYFNKIATDNIDVEEWVTGFSVFLKGNEEEWTQFCFNIYDLNEDGYITKEEIMTMMKNCFVHKDRDEYGEVGEGVRDLVEMTIKKMDLDRDGRISFSDFSTTVSREPLLLEAFGTCLPTSPQGMAWARKILDKQSVNMYG